MPPPVSHFHSSASDAGQASYSMASTIPPASSCQPALAPPNMPFGSSTNPADQRPSVPSRPKLTLQTRCLPKTTGASSSTGLSFSFVSGHTASPTVRNTFKNAYDVPFPSSATSSPSKSSSNKPFRVTSPYAANNPNSPYQLPLGVRSILRNSPLEPSSRRRSVSIAATGSGGSTPRRVFFPAKKQVNYRYPLEEEIKNVHYTARHSDIVGEPEPEPNVGSGSDDSDSSSGLEQSGSDEDNGIEGGAPKLGKIERKKRKQLSAQRQIRAVALLDGLEDGSTPQTPQDRSVKRRREWKWTLGSIETRNETFGFPRTPTKSGFDGVTSTPETDAPERETRSAEKETESCISCDSDFTSFSGFSGFSAASRQLSSPISSLESPETLDDSKTNMNHP